MSLSQEQQMLVDYLGLSSFNETTTNQIAFNCPFCDDYRKKMYVSPSGKFICFLCETKGNNIASFISQLNKISYKEALSIVHEYNLDVVYDDRFKENEAYDSLFSKLVSLENTNDDKSTTKYFPKYPNNTRDLNIHTEETKPFYNYLYNRGLTDKDIDEYHIKYVHKGLIETPSKSFPVYNHIVFTTYNKQGQPIYWNTRSIEKNPKIKSLNGLSNNSTTYTRKDCVFNLNRVKDDMVICEGVFNALTCTQGNYVGVATFGKVITNEQKKLIAQANPKHYYIFLDNDAKSEEIKLIKSLILDYGVPQEKIKLVYNSNQDKDANDLGKEKVKELLDNAKSINLLTLYQLQKGD